MGGAVKKPRQRGAMTRAMRTERAVRAESVAMPVFAYI